ncbi:MAG: efflux RND transporter periplasmic adaptor subunit [Propionivibrio sp.]|uniref:Efflux RND transporter periplasmic adaptor subunit n=1 Tax=Candidatus Propionivibrio dominans TaxID=2954373 RepID=A0A9D7F4S5_9RHOO|nr:efflux RND transporter periplasmic adaptor subunit [Candidatus Propionivibrio dominans]
MKVLILRGSLFLAMLVLIAACGKSVPPLEPPRPVLISILGTSDESGAVSYSGEVRSRFETPLGFRISGKIAARMVDTGAQVKAGDVLARLDPADTALSAAAADAQLDLAAADVRRYRELRDKNFVSQAALDAKETGFKAARAQGDLARNQSSYTVLRADQAGVVELVAAEVGQVVAAGQTVMRVARTDTLEVAVAIPETRMPDLRLLKAAEVSLWADEKARYQGVLRELSPVADALTRTYAARVSILNPDARVLLGMTANVKFLRNTNGGTSGSRLSVPLTAIFQQEGKPALWIVGADQTVALRPVTVASYGETTAILESGAQAGERIVVAGVHKLSAGEKIKAVDQVPASAPASVTANASVTASAPVSANAPAR